MRFSCQSCNAKYSIPDERVEGKVIRLKCQKCQGEIVVKGPKKGAAPPPEPPPQKSAKIAPVQRVEDRPAVRLGDEDAFGSAAEEEEEPRETTRIANLTELDAMRQKAIADGGLVGKPDKPKKVEAPPPPPTVPVSGSCWSAACSKARSPPMT